jgi:hypothetical protein
MPAEVEIPAPAIVMIFVAFPDLMYSTIPSIESSVNSWKKKCNTPTYLLNLKNLKLRLSEIFFNSK